MTDFSLDALDRLGDRVQWWRRKFEERGMSYVVEWPDYAYVSDIPPMNPQAVAGCVVRINGVEQMMPMGSRVPLGSGYF